jgi:uncharacterized coiled-coil protein SlyX
MLVRPTALDVINAFHGHLAATERHRTTSRELATAKGWALMEVSAALNQAAQRGSLIKEGATFRPAVSQIGTSLVKESALVPASITIAAVNGSTWPPDDEFARRYEAAKAFAEGATLGLEAEFHRPYNSIDAHAREVYARLGRPKPSAKGARQSLERATKITWPPDEEFAAIYAIAINAPTDVRGALERAFGHSYRAIRIEAERVYGRLGIPKPAGRRGKRAVESVTVEPTTANQRIPAAELEEFFADEPDDPRDGNATVIIPGVWEAVARQEREIAELKAENADLWAKLRQADADLTERDKRIHDMGRGIAGLEENRQELVAERARLIQAGERLEERLAATHRTIESLNARLAQAEARPQQITLTLTLPMDALHVSR